MSGGYGSVIYANDNNTTIETQPLMVTTPSRSSSRRDAGTMYTNSNHNLDEQDEEMFPMNTNHQEDYNDDIMENTPGIFQQMIAECIGTCILTQIGCASLCAQVSSK